MKCPLCLTDKNEKYSKDFFICKTCSGIYRDVDLYLNPEEEKKCYELHINDVNDKEYQKFVQPIVKHVLSNFDPSDYGLDFGSGPGPVTSKLLSDKGYSIFQYDPFFAYKPDLLNSRYNYIVSCEVIEHFFNPEVEFHRLYEMLKPGGQLVCMTHLYDEEVPFENWYYKNDPCHVFIYQAKTIEYISKKFGFENFEINNRLIVFQK